MKNPFNKKTDITKPDKDADHTKPDSDSDYTENIPNNKDLENDLTQPDEDADHSGPDKNSDNSMPENIGKASKPYKNPQDNQSIIF